MADLKDEIKLVANAEGVETGVSRAKRSLATLGQAVDQVGDQGEKGFKRFGAGGEDASRRIDSSTKNMVSNLQRQIAALEAGGTANRKYQESIARMRGADMNVLKPYLDQLDAAKAKAEGATRAQQGMEKGMGTLGTAAGFLRAQMVALVGSFTFAAGVAYVRQVTDALDALNDVKDATGASIENISALEGVAMRTGTSLDVVTTSMVKLNEVLNKAKPGSDHALALKAIGLEAEELRKLDPAEALRRVAVALSNYADDGNKARIVQSFFSKSIREMAPFLADLAEQTQLVGKVTAEQAAEAEKFNKQLFELKTRSTEAGRAMVSGMLPGLNQIAEAMNKGAKEGGVLLGVYRAIAEFGSIAFGTDKLGKELSSAKDAQAEMLRLSRLMQGPLLIQERDPANEANNRRIASLRAQLEAVQKKALEASTAIKGLVDPPKAPEAPQKQSVVAPEDGATVNAAAADALSARLQAFKNNDKAILDNRKAFYDTLALLSKVGAKSEMDAIEESLAKEEEVWAQRKANFDAELAEAAKKKNSQAEVARITGQVADAERDHFQTVAKLRADAVAAEQKYSDALGERITKQMAAAGAAQEQVRLAQLEGKAIGLTGDALREHNQLQVEDKARRLEALALWASGVDASGKLAQAYRNEAAGLRQLHAEQGMNRSAQLVNDYSKGIEESNRLLQAELGLMGQSEQARNTALEQLRIRLELEKKIAEVKALEVDTPERAARISQLEASAAIAKANAANRAFLDEWKQSVNKYDDIFRQGFADMLNNGKAGWKSFTKSLATTFKTTVADQIYKMFAQPFVVRLVGSFMGLFGGGMAGAGGVAGAAGAGSPLGMASNAFSLYNMGSQAWTLGSQYLGGTMSGANVLGTMWANGTGGGLDALLATNGAYGTAGTGAGGAGMSGMAGSGVFAAVAAIILNGLGAFRSDRRVASGLRGTLGSGEITPWEEWREGGTLFSGPEYTTFNPVEALTRERARLQELRDMGADPSRIVSQQMVVDNLEDQYGGLAEAAKKQSDYIQKVFGGMKDSVIEMGEVLGLSTSKVKDFTTQLGGDKGINLEGLNPQEQQAKIAEALATANNELAQQILGTWETTTTDATRILTENVGSYGEDAQLVYTELTDTITTTRYVASEYAKDGEKAIDTLTRLAKSLSTVNTIWDQLGYTLLDASLKGADAASRIADAFGGLEAMTAATGSYFQNFYSNDERREAQRRALQGELDKYGLKLPDIDSEDARAQYRALAEAQDRNTEEGLKAYVALIQLSGAFASITTEAEDAAAAVQKQRESYYNALQRAVEAENKVLRSQLDAAQEVADTLGGLFDLLHDNVRELYGEVDSTRAMQAGQGNEFITQSLAAAIKTGYLPDADKLAEAIGAARSGIDGGAYTSQFAQDRDRLVLAGKLSGLEGIAEKQLNDAQKTVRALETQIEQNEQTLDYWQQQIEIASGTYEATVSVAQAVNDLKVLLGGTPSTDGIVSGGSGGGGTGPTGGPSQGRVSYGADEALGSFEKFKAWYVGLRNTADPNLFTDGGYKVPDWMRVSGFADDASDEELFGQYQFFQNNRQYAADFERIYTTGRSSYATDGSTLIKSDLSRMPAEVAEYFRSNNDALLSYEGMGLDPVLAYQLYKYGPEKFGLDRKQNNFTDWLRKNKWTEGGIVANDNMAEFLSTPYADYRQNRYDPTTGNIVGMDGNLYTLDGRVVGRAPQSLLDTTYGPGFKPSVNGRSELYNAQVGDGDATAYYSAIRASMEKAINEGKSAQWIADAIGTTGASMQDVATAYGISVAELRDNLLKGGATRIPAFAVGTNYVPRDMLAYIHEGEQIIPKAYNPAANPGMAGGNAELVTEVRALREQNAAMAARLEAIEKNTNLMPQMGRQFDQYSNGGQFSRQKAVA